MTWNDLPEDVRATMELFEGGWTKYNECVLWLVDEEGEVYKKRFTSEQMRQMAAHFVTVADWLDKRAEMDSMPPPDEAALDAQRE